MSQVTEIAKEEAADLAAHFKALDADFVTKFKEANIRGNSLSEFVYAMDHLDELMQLDECPKNKMLLSPDVLERNKVSMFMLFNEFYRLTNDEAWTMVPINAVVKESLQQFFEHKYLMVINFMIESLGVLNAKGTAKDLRLEVSGVKYLLQIDEITPKFELGVLHFNDLDTGLSLHIPFMKNRVDHLLNVA